jgi:hypothetical protein
LVDPVRSFDQLHLQIFEYKYFLWDKPRMLLANSNWWAAVRGVFMPPGWTPGAATTWMLWWRMADTEDGIPKVSVHAYVYVHMKLIHRSMVL